MIADLYNALQNCDRCLIKRKVQLAREQDHSLNLRQRSRNGNHFNLLGIFHRTAKVMQHLLM